MVQSLAERVTKDPNSPVNRDVIHPAFDDPQIGSLATPINSSPVVRAYMNNLPAYRRGLSSIRRGLEVGMAHGYWLIGPFVKLGPLRNTDVANLAGLISTIGLLIISTLAISLYASVSFPEPKPVIAAPKIPETFKTHEGWSEYASGFLIGGIGGALVAYALLEFVIGKFNYPFL